MHWCWVRTGTVRLAHSEKLAILAELPSIRVYAVVVSLEYSSVDS